MKPLDALTLERTAQTRCFGGTQEVYKHHSPLLDCDMNFAVYLPEQAVSEHLPVLYFLSGLTCTEQNVVTKSGLQRHAADHNLIVVCPDTSPRGQDVPDDAASDLGQGAGFYLDATEPPWSSHFKMRSYLTSELPQLIQQQFLTTGKVGITGHSMGGHGALTLGLSLPSQYNSISAFAPIVNPSKAPWGRKAFSHYLGQDESTWKAHDACELVKAQARADTPLFIDQGSADPFLKEQLRPEVFESACKAAGQPLTLRMQPGYDHSYYFISTFLRDHIEHHAQVLHKS